MKNIVVDSLKSLVLQIDADYLGQDVAITGININSRLIKEGQLFVAIKAIRDGHEFINSAIEKGAVAVMVDRKIKDLNVPQIVVSDTKSALLQLAKIHRQSLKMPMIAITGSCGKTTVKEMLVCILKSHYNVHYSQGNFNNDLGIPMVLFDTPKEADVVVLEAGTNSPGEIAVLADLIKPQIATITNVSASHLEKLKSLDGVMAEKGELLRSLPLDGVAVINLDDERIVLFSTSLNCKKISLSMRKDPKADLYLERLDFVDEGMAVTFGYHGDKAAGFLPLTGRHQVQDALIACALAMSFDVDLKMALSTLRSFHSYQGRMVKSRLNARFSLIDDSYNASVPSVKAAIETLSQSEGMKLFIMSNMGELGDKAKQYHRQMGRWIAESRIDKVFLYGDKNLLSLTVKESGGKAQYFASKEEMAMKLGDIMGDTDNGGTILIKGSRANRMEELIKMMERF